MTSYQNPKFAALDAVEDLLDAYAEARLSPTQPVLKRIRKSVMAEAASVEAMRAAENRRAEAAALRAAEGPHRRFGFPRLSLASLARPAFALGFAGLLALSTGTAITAASPGSPLYMARVALEHVFLPVQIDARFASHEQHLNERIAEAEAAADRGDADALAAALAAYRDEVDQTLADVGDDYRRLEQFQTSLEAHVAKLTALSVRLPTSVARGNAEEHAVQASTKAAAKAADTLTTVEEQKADAKNKPVSPTDEDNTSGHPSTPPGQGQNPDRGQH